ncbi:hypothetical protein [Herbidospora daliensis]|uniref:hypothetical protein n=1 Tax=Herbidospora daliensis TaxID=295585 RepID=UPI0007843493|nr:hypothetical protein [Herbidospora daliensis]
MDVKVGDVLLGTVLQDGVLLDGDLAGVPAAIGPLDASWQVPAEEVLQVGRRITAEVIAVTDGRVALSSAATENPDL